MNPARLALQKAISLAVIALLTAWASPTKAIGTEPVSKNKSVFQIRCIPRNMSKEMKTQLGEMAYQTLSINLKAKELRYLSLDDYVSSITEITPDKIVAKKQHGEREAFVETFNRNNMNLYWERRVDGVKRDGSVSTCTEWKP